MHGGLQLIIDAGVQHAGYNSAGHMVRLAELTSPAAARLARDPKAVVLLPLGAIEQHGPEGKTDRPAPSRGARKGLSFLTESPRRVRVKRTPSRACAAGECAPTT